MVPSRPGGAGGGDAERDRGELARGSRVGGLRSPGSLRIRLLRSTAEMRPPGSDGIEPHVLQRRVPEPLPTWASDSPCLHPYPLGAHTAPRPNPGRVLGGVRAPPQGAPAPGRPRNTRLAPGCEGRRHPSRPTLLQRPRLVTLTYQAPVTAVPCSGLSGTPSLSSDCEVYAPELTDLSPLGARFLRVPARAVFLAFCAGDMVCVAGSTLASILGLSAPTGWGVGRLTSNLWPWPPPQVVTFPGFRKTSPISLPTLRGSPGPRRSPLFPF